MLLRLKWSFDTLESQPRQIDAITEALYIARYVSYRKGNNGNPQFHGAGKQFGHDEVICAEEQGAPAGWPAKRRSAEDGQLAADAGLDGVLQVVRGTAASADGAMPLERARRTVSARRSCKLSLLRGSTIRFVRARAPCLILRSTFAT